MKTLSWRWAAKSGDREERYLRTERQNMNNAKSSKMRSWRHCILHSSNFKSNKKKERNVTKHLAILWVICFIALWFSAEQLVTSIAAATAELKALHRHTATLKKEIDLDERERNAVEDSVNNCLTSALNDYAIVLELSTVARKLRIIFNYFSCIYVK